MKEQLQKNFQPRKSKHHFIIKYNLEIQRVKFASIIIRLIKEFELKDFHVEEIKAFVDTRIFYNSHTLVTGDNFSYDLIEKELGRYVKI